MGAATSGEAATVLSVVINDLSALISYKQQTTCAVYSTHVKKWGYGRVEKVHQHLVQWNVHYTNMHQTKTEDR